MELNKKELVAMPRTSITQAARYGFDSEQIATIRRTVAKDCTDHELLMMLELAGRYELDPFAGEIYAAKMPGRDGAGGSMALIVGKNGMLKVANREPSFKALRSDTIYEGDHFEVTHGDGVQVKHSYAVSGKRGKENIVGAWAIVEREDRSAPVFFYADFDTYNKGKATWKQFPAAMIRKVAVANALREAFSLSGLYDEAEMPTVVEGQAEVVIEQEPDYGDDPAFADYLRRLFEEANRVKPGSFLPQKVRVHLAGKTQAQRSQVAAEVEQFIQKHGGVVPGIAEGVEDAEEVQDVTIQAPPITMYRGSDG